MRGREREREFDQRTKIPIFVTLGDKLIGILVLWSKHLSLPLPLQREREGERERERERERAPPLEREYPREREIDYPLHLFRETERV